MAISRLEIPAAQMANVKASWAHEYSQGRVSSTSQLYEPEMERLLQDLSVRQVSQVDSDERMRTKVFAIMRSIGWIKDGKPDYDHLSAWLRTNTSLKGDHLRQYNGLNLREVVTALERIETSFKRKKR
jgi:hypothetical protein